MFPLNSGDELFFNASSNPHQQYNIPEDLICGRDSQDASNITNNSGRSRRRRKSCVMDTADDTNSDNNKKKMMHRDIERQRRQEMATLHASLRSLLPLEYIKLMGVFQGKRSMSDQMNEAVNYIKHLEVRIKELGVRRDELKKSSNSSSHGSESGSSDQSVCQSNIIVRQSLVGVEVVYGCGYWEQGLPLSRVIEILLDEGLRVVNCISTKVSDRLLHTIQTEVNDPSCFNLGELQQKLTSEVA
ncbi:transcription factor bHLH36 isoform X2 [Pistacia vera]|uniref:transcription factor bHLH36 isoform X2 n=1 Tax=Pistacia vera TaxID=55513 RepID=UPI001263D65C|nr:transcription factor bHLH36 isoform X2 [Pistacia vera]